MDTFSDIIKKLKKEDIDEEAIEEWEKACDDNEPIYNHYLVRKEQNVLLTILGYYICNER